MSRKSDEELKPRNGHTLEVRAVCRISGCPRQKEMSLEDQEQNAREFVIDAYSHRYEFECLSTIGKGECLERPELAKIEEMYRSNLVDLVIYDELSRLVRGQHAVTLLGIGVDHGVRSICLADGIDTIEATWEEDALNACSENVAHNQRTSHRVKTRMMNRFKRHGFTPLRLIPGYEAPEGALSFNDWVKTAGAEEWVYAGRDLLFEARDYSLVGDYFNKLGVPVGPCCKKSDVWTGTLVKAFYTHPLLVGQARRGTKTNVKLHQSGKRVPRTNPKGPNFYPVPHLAYFDEAEGSELKAVIKEITAANKGGGDRNAARIGVPRKRTLFPGQFARCGYCGRLMLWGGNGRGDNLMCGGARNWNCWNSFSFSGGLATRLVVDHVVHELEGLAGFDEQFRELTAAAGTKALPELERQRRQLAADERQLAAERANVDEVIRTLGMRGPVLAACEKLEQLEKSLLSQRRAIAKLTKRPLALPSSITELRRLFHEEFAQVAQDSPEFNPFLQKIVADFHVYLVRLCDHPAVYPRARITLAFDGLAPDLRHVEPVRSFLRQEITLDLFEAPERARIMPEAVRLQQEIGHKPKAIAGLLAQQTPWRPSDTAVQRALKLHKRMIEQNLTSPFVVVTAPPDDYPRMRRHKNARYRFEPVAGYRPPPLV
ncbi:MAG: hypothetical protein JNK76_16080 [Planctomycetales bacterium]|nr:hypothetical protein [Planctomycetales bacterium]MBN8624796.1 hypothetical protein [Planctomycetota bacterium]